MKWQFTNPDPQIVSRLKTEFKSSEIIARVLASRGIASLEESRTFFNPTLDQLNDPFLMKDMDLAVKKIISNIESKEQIMIYGDYDVDGTTGASALFLALTELGAKAKPYIPNRGSEGYGLSKSGIDLAKQLLINLIVTCDCGINEVEHIEYANSLGIDVIITDHHIPNEILPPAYAILNPKRPDCKYPFKNLCGGGVALKLISAIAQKLNKPSQFSNNYLDLITLGTCADMVSITEENRIIVKHGLKLLSQENNCGLKELYASAGLKEKSLSVGQIVFGIAPKINAAGRLGDANRSVELLTTTDVVRAKSLANELVEENHNRQIIQKEVVDAAFNMINANIDLEKEKAIVLAGHNWHQGVIGIVASKVKEEYNRPTVIVSYDDNGIGKGSARSLPGLDIYSALTASSKHLLDFGGHSMAAGLSVEEKNFQKFKEEFNNFINEAITKEHLIPTIRLEGILQLSEINSRMMDFLDKLAPYGPGNMRPAFGVKNVEVTGNPRVVGNGDHVIFKVRQKQKNISAIGFNLSKHYQKLIKGLPIDLAFVVETNKWQGRETIQLNVRDIKMSDKDEELI